MIVFWCDVLFCLIFFGRIELIVYCEFKDIFVKVIVVKFYSSDENCFYISYEVGEFEFFDVNGVDCVDFGMIVLF